VTDENDLIELEIFNHGDNILSKSGDCPRLTIGPGLAMAREVDRHDCILLDKRSPLLFPIGKVTAPSMDKHKSGRSFASDLIVDGNTIGRSDRVFGDAGLIWSCPVLTIPK
jgi:hypothetical protein